MTLTNEQNKLLEKLKTLMPTHKYDKLVSQLKEAKHSSDTYVLLGAAGEKYLMRSHGDVIIDFFDEVYCYDYPDLIG